MICSGGIDNLNQRYHSSDSVHRQPHFRLTQLANADVPNTAPPVRTNITPSNSDSQTVKRPKTKEPSPTKSTTSEMSSRAFETPAFELDAAKSI